MESESDFPLETYHGKRWGELGAAAFFLFYFALTLLDPVGSGLLRWLLTGAMGFNGFFFLRRGLDPRPRLLVDAEGITDRTSFSGSTLFIPWTEVEAVQPTIGKKMLEVRVRDLDQTRRRAGWVRRVWLGIRRLWGKKTIPIFIGMLGVEKDQITDLIENGMVAQERKELGFSAAPLELGPEDPEPESAGERE
ncbi:MAG: hypothetical protein PVJ76_14665 [Gemmatimonadota bacterium]|jgi:hypothetical protein